MYVALWWCKLVPYIVVGDGALLVCSGWACGEGWEDGEGIGHEVLSPMEAAIARAMASSSACTEI